MSRAADLLKGGLLSVLSKYVYTEAEVTVRCSDMYTREDMCREQLTCLRGATDSPRGHFSTVSGLDSEAQPPHVTVH